MLQDGTFGVASEQGLSDLNCQLLHQYTNSSQERLHTRP